ncbi:MAG: succinyl-diaminopimelate desuccinylase [Actinobacteria bacterium]|nr:succinyl-diaminopimelate desuccinylase [Actinomycetota bacterium]
MASLPALLDLNVGVVELTSALVDFPSESRSEGPLADAVENALKTYSHLEILRDGNTIVARTNLGLPERVVIAGHLDTVPSSGNDRSLIVSQGGSVPVADVDGKQKASEDRLYGLGSCDMKGGLAVALLLAAKETAPTRDVTYIFYDCEEIDADLNGLKRISEKHPDWIKADFAVLMEPSNAVVEGGCQGTMRIEIRTSGRRAHTARSWMGENAIHGLGQILEILENYVPDKVLIDGLEYREGLQAVDVYGGVAGNVVPDSASISINYRFAPNKSAADALKHLEQVFVGYQVDVVDYAEGALPGLSRPAAKQFIESVIGDPQPKFGWTDVALFSALNIPAVNFGPGFAALAHAPNEYVPVAQLHSTLAAMQNWLSK